MVDISGQMKNLSEIGFAVNPDMACTLFTSCKKVSLIAQASIQSSISFLDFLVSKNTHLTLILGSKRPKPVSRHHHFQPFRQQLTKQKLMWSWFNILLRSEEQDWPHPRVSIDLPLPRSHRWPCSLLDEPPGSQNVRLRIPSTRDSIQHDRWLSKHQKQYLHVLCSAVWTTNNQRQNSLFRWI